MTDREKINTAIAKLQAAGDIALAAGCELAKIPAVDALDIADLLERMSNTIEHCVGVIASAPTVGGWISVKDTLPMQREYIVESNVLRDTSKYVLIYITATFPFERKFVTIGRYDFQHERWVVRSSHNGSVTHWMPLPEPPEEENDEQK